MSPRGIILGTKITPNKGSIIVVNGKDIPSKIPLSLIQKDVYYF